MRDRSRSAALGHCFGMLVVLVTCCIATQAQDPPYRNSALPIEQRMADLISRMTLEEKVTNEKTGRP
jgi:beta-glucosidase